uniref:Uncharacterized protein n=1 Tax=Trichuris muris TaxID=70415 RepID=A0A5S6Q425_TRIMR
MGIGFRLIRSIPSVKLIGMLTATLPAWIKCNYNIRRDNLPYTFGKCGDINERFYCRSTENLSSGHLHMLYS